MGRTIRVLAVLVLAAAGCKGDDASLNPWSGDVSPPPDPGADEDIGLADVARSDVADCPEPGCLPGFVCIDGACEPGCRFDLDCPEGQHCLPESLPYGFCAECAQDDHCWTGHCLAGQCRIGCMRQEDCAALHDAPVCDPVNGVCVGCIDRNDCAPGHLCLRSNCVPGCTGDDGCPNPLFCDPDASEHGTCVPCAQDVHCTGGRRCLDHRCVFDCGTISCPFDRPRCVPETGACVECIDSSHCLPSQVCLGNVCLPGCLRDEDCGEGLVCTGGSPGRCVGCETEADCPDGAACVLDQCVLDPCADDIACGEGRYCHPLLKGCRDLPEGACSQDRDCGLIPGTQLGRNCDPLTRTCIPECLPGGYCLDGSMFCIEGSCYGCRIDGDCPGTRCDPFDRACVSCSGDGDCLNAGWHCAVGTGACHPCVFDAHCGVGGRCHPEKHRCVECMIDADCRTVERPVCGKDNVCAATCEDECDAGSTQCAPLGDGTSGIRSCGDHDLDPCLEPGTAQACPAGQACRVADGVGACVCSEECTAGDQVCVDGDAGWRRVCIVDPATGCPRWVNEKCEVGAACSGGVCACTGECTYPSSKCDPDNITYYYYCGREGGSCLHWIHLKCDHGATCDSRTGTCTGGYGN